MKLPGQNYWKPALATPHWRPANRGGQRLAQVGDVGQGHPYSEIVLTKLTAYGVGTLGGLVIGSLVNVIFPSLRSSRQDAITQASLLATIGAVAIALPFSKGFMGSATGMASLLSGTMTGSALASVALPHRRTA